LAKLLSDFKAVQKDMKLDFEAEFAFSFGLKLQLEG